MGTFPETSKYWLQSGEHISNDIFISCSSEHVQPQKLIRCPYVCAVSAKRQWPEYGEVLREVGCALGTCKSAMVGLSHSCKTANMEVNWPKRFIFFCHQQSWVDLGIWRIFWYLTWIYRVWHYFFQFVFCLAFVQCFHIMLFFLASQTVMHI